MGNTVIGHYGDLKTLGQFEIKGLDKLGEPSRPKIKIDDLIRGFTADEQKGAVQAAAATPANSGLANALNGAAQVAAGANAAKAPRPQSLVDLVDQRPVAPGEQRKVHYAREGSDAAKSIQALIGAALPSTKGLGYTQAVEAYQQARNLRVDGKAGPETLRALRSDKSLEAASKTSSKQTQQFFAHAPKAHGATDARASSGAPAPAPSTVAPANASAASAPAASGPDATALRDAATMRDAVDAMERGIEQKIDRIQALRAGPTMREAVRAMERGIEEKIDRIQALRVPNDPLSQASQQVGACAAQQGIDPSGAAAQDVKTMLARGQGGRIGSNLLDPAIAQRSLDPEVHAQVRALAACLRPAAEQAGTEQFFDSGLQAYEMARAVGARSQQSPAVAAKARELGLIE